MEASLIQLKVTDREWLSAVLDKFQERTELLIKRIEESDREALIKWQKKMSEKMDLLIARRLVRLEIIMESRAGEKILEVRSVHEGSPTSHIMTEQEINEEAKKRALDRVPFESIMKEATADFETASHDNIKQLLEASNEEGRLLELHISVEDRQFADELDVENPTSQEEFDKLVTARDLKRQSRLIKVQAKREISLEEIFTLNSQANSQFLAGVKEVSLDELDDICLGGRSLEDFCFDY